MMTLRSYVADAFAVGQAPLTPLHNPATEETIAETGTAGVGPPG